MSSRRSRRRRGTSAVEFAIVCPITFFLLFAIMIGSVGIYRYQKVAALAREASRWASVRGQEYEMETGNHSATAEDIFQQAILPQAAGLDTSLLTYAVEWDQSNAPISIDPATEKIRGNSVIVTVTYRWSPLRYLIGPIDLTSTSTSQMMY
jgi:Flp pilus assembly protein TadG